MLLKSPSHPPACQDVATVCLSFASVRPVGPWLAGFGVNPSRQHSQRGPPIIGVRHAALTDLIGARDCVGAVQSRATRAHYYGASTRCSRSSLLHGLLSPSFTSARKAWCGQAPQPKLATLRPVIVAVESCVFQVAPRS